MKKAILWDNDGVLVNTEPLYFRANQEIMRHYDFELTIEIFAEVSLRQGKGVIEIDEFKNRFSPEELAAIKEERNEIYSGLLRSEDCKVDGAFQVLGDLAKSFQMGIVTSSKREHFELIHQSSGLLPFFEFALTPEQYHGVKPHPGPYLAGLEKIGVSTKECIVIEDSERGLSSARAAGLDCIIIRHEITKDHAFKGASHIVDHLQEIAEELIHSV